MSCKEDRPDPSKEIAVRVDGVLYSVGQKVRFEREGAIVGELQQLLVAARPEANDTKYVVHVELFMYYESGRRSHVLVLGEKDLNGLVQIDGRVVRTDTVKLRAIVDALKEQKVPSTTKSL